MKRWVWFVPIILLLSFIAISFYVQKDYGSNWDDVEHLVRGQAYYHFFLTGKTINEDDVPYQGRMSFYEKIPYDFGWGSKTIFGHPPATDIILSTFNQILYKRFGLIGDLEAYHFYGVLLTSIGALIIIIWSYEISGWVGTCFSLVAYGTFPLLFAEQHFNIKDPAIAAYNLIFLYCLWLGISKKKHIFLLFAGIIGGLSLGTKFDILFLFPAIVIWLIWFAKGNILGWIRRSGLRFCLLLLSIPLIMFVIFYSSYPDLWSNPLQNVWSVVRFYQNIGGNRCPYVPTTGLWFVRCIDWNTVRLFLVTIPIPTIVLAIVGGVVALNSFSVFGLAPFLWFITAALIIIRVILPIESLYGGSLRQITEFIGPMALLVGFGATWISGFFKKAYIVPLGIFLCYIFVIQKMIVLHPNENLYTNALSDIVWKNEKQQFINGIVSYGNAYKPGIDWINKHAEPGSKVSLVTGIGSALPTTVFRPDLHFSVYWSGYKQQGEYLIELVDAGGHATQFFPYKYATKILQPVYEAKVEGYPVVRVWKNDITHVRPEFRQLVPLPVRVDAVTRTEIVLRLEQPTKVQSLQITMNDTACRSQMMNTYVLVSENGKVYQRMYETMQEMNSMASQVLVYTFAGEYAAFIKLFSFAPTGCDWSSLQYSILGFK